GQPRSIASNELAKHYGLTHVPSIIWLPGPRRLFPWRAVGVALRQKADLIHTWAVQSAVLGSLLGIPSLFEAHEMPSGRFGPLWYRLFLNLPGRKRLLPITDALRRALEERYGPIRRGDVVLAPDGVDLERYAALPSPAEARHLIGLPEALTVMCTGHLYEGRGADLFLTLAVKFPQTSFVWVGGRAEDVAYWKERANGLRNVLFTGFIQHERIPLYQAAADVLLMPYRRNVSGSSGGNIAAVFSPMKLFEYMAAGRAILTSDLPVLREVLDENMAVFCPPEEVGAWETALRGLLADERRRQALGQHAQHAVKAYSWVERARRMLEGLTQQV
ncbi:MAG: glycosyltransferase, partial [Anaerolineales bacterium]|nr:glycosyltransferase [Anaerolineales bacterium]